jgi:serine/threonine protein kinase/Flp pilus assembly protein TadD
MGTKPSFNLNPEQLNELLALGAEGINSDLCANPDISTTSDLSKAAVQRLGTWVGQYKLAGFLGEGGMAYVYLAEQEYPIQRKVALKLIKPGMDSTLAVARFQAERQALALLDHLNIAHIYDAGTTDSGQPYFAMEYVEGLTITEHCDRHRLTIEERLKLFLQICHAVHHAHQKGIIHRDIKPSNILISCQDNQAVPKIIDFGVAKIISLPLTERILFTEQGQLFGTPEYMSPEQADMASEDIDTRSDIYSLGVLLYVLLTGVLPFDSKTLRGGGVEHIRQIIREADPKTPSTRLSSLGEEAKLVAQNRQIEVADLAKYLHKELEWIPLKAMRKERSERYRSVAELADDVENYLNGAPLIAGPESTTYLIKKFVKRKRALVIGISAILVVLMAGIIVSMVFAFGQARARAEAQAVSDFLKYSVLESLDPYKVEDRQISVRSILDAVSKDLEGKFQRTPMVEAEIRHTIGFAYWSLGLYEQHELHLGRAVDICRAQLGEKHATTLLWVKELGWGYYNRSRFKDAEKLFSEAVEGMRRVLGEEHKELPHAMASLGCVYIMQGRFNEAEKLLLKAYEIERNKLREENGHLVYLIMMLGCGYTIESRYNEAERLFKKGLEISRSELGEQNWHVLHLMHNYGELYLDLGLYKEAEDMLLETVARRSRSCGQQHPDTIHAMAMLGQLYHYQGRYEEAELLLLEALETSRESASDEYMCTLGAMYRLAELYLTQERVDEAEPLLLKVSDILCRILGEESWLTLKVRSTLAQVYRMQDRHNQAEPLYLKTLKAQRRVLGDEHPLTLVTVNGLAVLRMQQGHFEDANDLFHEALRGRQNKLGNEHPATLETKNDLGRMYKEQAHNEEAEKYFLEAIKGRRLKLGDKHPHTQQSVKNLIELYEAWHKPEEAEEWLAKLKQIEATNK